MATLTNIRRYKGDGTRLSGATTTDASAKSVTLDDDPAGYLADDGLRDAVNVALALGQPIFVTGEPGTGKTQLAGSIAYELGLPPPLVFNTKTTSTAKDLFYRYDSLRHFHDIQVRKEFSRVESYITVEALGLAILLAQDQRETVSSFIPPNLQKYSSTQSVVLVDEVDKAPRDLPNDILNEIEQMSFSIPEMGRTFTSPRTFRPIVVFTSNSEKNLPDAFLRRCIFYHIPFPDRARLKSIVQRRLAVVNGFTPEMADHAITHFQKIRDLALKKRPATAEFLAWMKVLQLMQVDVGQLKHGDAEALAITYSILAKNHEDAALLSRV